MHKSFTLLGCSAALLLAGGHMAQAQSTVTFGPRLGLNVSTISYEYPDIPFGLSNEAKSVTGVQVGGTLNMAFGKVAFQPSLLYSQKGAELILSATDNSGQYKSTAKFTVTPTFGYLEIPLNAVYTTGEDQGFQLFAGPYVAFGVGGSGTGKVDISSTDPDVESGSYPFSVRVEYGENQNDNSNNSNSNTPVVTITARRFDAGLNAGVGYKKGPYQVQLGYGLGLVNFTPNDPEGNDTGGKTYNRVLQLSANYFFGAK